jgi:hypothetical protein
VIQAIYGLLGWDVAKLEARLMPVAVSANHMRMFPRRSNNYAMCCCCSVAASRCHVT